MLMKQKYLQTLSCAPASQIAGPRRTSCVHSSGSSAYAPCPQDRHPAYADYAWADASNAPAASQARSTLPLTLAPRFPKIRAIRGCTAGGVRTDDASESEGANAGFRNSANQDAAAVRRLCRWASPSGFPASATPYLDTGSDETSTAAAGQIS